MYSASEERAPQRPGVDVVYTWVDDSLPGFAAEQHRHARNAHDLNPNRTRDNIDVLRYSLRSLEMFAPWVRHVHLLTCRPQVPAWLDRSQPGLRVVHHDEIMPASMLPTFNSFAIISYLHELPGLSDEFIYFNDDMLLGRPVSASDFRTAQGRTRVFATLAGLPRPAWRREESVSPWNRAKAEVIHRMQARFGKVPREYVEHVPLWVNRRQWARAMALWPDATELTRNSRFRDTGNLTMEYLYTHWLALTGQAEVVPWYRTPLESMYMPLENSPWLARALVAAARWRRPKFLTLNDNFGDSPNPRVVSLVRGFLESYWPRASRFERTASA